jgi:Zn-dependent protease with chaperone function
VRQVLAIVTPLYEIALLVLLLATGLSARMRDAARRWSRNRYGRVVVYLGLFTVVMVVLEAPLSWFAEYFWEHRFGLSNQGLGAWAWEGIESAALSFLFAAGTGLVAIALLFLERVGRRAWLWLALGMLPVMVAGVLLEPLVFDPAFNHFTPLHDAQLRGKILALAERVGIPGRAVYEVDKSKQTNKLNAYVNGFGPSQRIVLWDTSLQAFSEDEMLSVMGHEMGHYTMHHLWKGIALFWVLGFFVLFATDRIARAVLARRGAGGAVTAMHDEAAIPLIAAVLLALLFVTGPISNAFSREIEHQAIGSRSTCSTTTMRPCARTS